MSRWPCAANSSASFSVETVIGPGVSPCTMRVTSVHLAVFTCRRSCGPSAAMCARMRAALASSLPRSSSRTGVSSSASAFTDCTPCGQKIVDHGPQCARLRGGGRCAPGHRKTDAVMPERGHAHGRGAEQVEPGAGDEQHALRGQAEVLQREPIGPGIGFVKAGTLGGHDDVERHLHARRGLPAQALRTVGDHTEPVLRGEVAQQRHERCPCMQQPMFEEETTTATAWCEPVQLQDR